jgi:hypothetical protein
MAARRLAGDADEVPALPRRSHVPPAWARRHARERLGIEADEIDGGHYVALSRPRELAERLDAYASGVRAT